MNVREALRRENNNLDLIRIILASAVIFGHTIVINGFNRLWIDPINYTTKFTYTGGLAVKVFFFISGLVVTNSLIKKHSPVHFITSRFFRLIPALLFVLLITAFVVGPLFSILPAKDYLRNPEVYDYVFGNLQFNTRFTLPGLFTNNLYKLSINGSLWSLRYEVQCYIVLLAIFLITRKKIILNIFFCSILLATLFYPHLFIYLLGERTELNLLPISFALGSLFALNAEKIRLTLPVTALLFLFFLALLLLKAPYYAEILLISFSCYSLLLLSVNKRFCKLRPKYDMSYGIYLWGFLVQQVVYFLFGHLYTGLHFLIALLISMAIALFSIVYIELPAIETGKKVSLAITNLIQRIKKKH